MPEVSLKFFMPVKVASKEQRNPREEINKALQEIDSFLKEKKIKVVGSAMALLHDDPKNVDISKAHFEICLPISGKIKGESAVKDKELPKLCQCCFSLTLWRNCGTWIRKSFYSSCPLDCCLLITI